MVFVFSNCQIQTHDGWVQSANSTGVLCRPPVTSMSCFKELVILTRACAVELHLNDPHLLSAIKLILFLSIVGKQPCRFAQQWSRESSAEAEADDSTDYSLSASLVKAVVAVAVVKDYFE